MSEKDDENHDVPADDETPIIEEGAETLEVGEIEPIDPLEEALKRAETAEKEIAYKNAEIQNVKKLWLKNPN